MVHAGASGLTQEQARARLAEVGRNVLAEPKRPSAIRRFAANLVHLFAVLLGIGRHLGLRRRAAGADCRVLVVILVNAVFAFVQESRAERATKRFVESCRGPQECVGVARSTRSRPRSSCQATSCSSRLEIASAPTPRSCRSTSSGSTTPRSRGVPSGRAGAARVRRNARRSRKSGSGRRRDRHVHGVRQDRRADPASGGQAESTRAELRRVTRSSWSSHSARLALLRCRRAPGQGLEERSVFAIGVTVANVPEGAASTVTLSLALGTQRMARRNALVRRLSSAGDVR